MKEKFKNDSFSDREWEEIASSPSEINIDEAWDKLHARLVEAGTYEEKVVRVPIYMRSTFLRIAAAALILLGIGSAMLYMAGKDYFSRKVVIATGISEKNRNIILPDGSSITLNRNTSLTYRSSFGKRDRNVTLDGEAFFDITPDAAKPFIIDAGKVNVRVVGTSFNVITQNIDSTVEVYVKTGKVMLSENSGTRNIILEPGYVGTIAGKKINDNLNYLSWNTNLLVYDGQRLETVFRDLLRVYNMKIVADDKEILNETWKVEINNQSQETIISLICGSFNLSYRKEGEIFHLSRK